ncbi:c-type cytochrome [Haloferula sp. BvORR071]|uniref:c-type cytochrome n=1 Tax=Haloferula sp. BvORR071 TaxID=1396141 RepID=UPI0005580F59|nr:c-type cytochrome [Haloferula sp. BvORR071]
MRSFLLLARLALPLSFLTTAARAELTAAFEGGGMKDTRADRLPALLVNAGESATPFLPPGEFSVTWTGKLVSPGTGRQRLEFSFEGEGSATLTIDAKEVHKEEGKLGATTSAVTRLTQGEHDVSITYKSKADGTGRFRLFWKEALFPLQSVPPGAFKAEVTPDPIRHGRLLMAENHCTKCHVDDIDGKSAMNPLFQESAPIIVMSGGRLNEEWVARWIADPSALRHDARMPALVDASTPEGKQQAADLAAYVMTLKGAPAPAAPDKALAEKGGGHFHRLGCAACHTSPGAAPAEDSVKDRVPLHNVAAKFQPGALVGFLKEPEATYPHIGMPNFHLSDEEANSLAAFLLEQSGKVEKKPAGFPKGDATKGAALAQTLNCGACHAGLIPNPGSAPGLAATFKADWSAKGCVSGKHGGKVPKIPLSEDDRKDLLAFVKKEKAAESLARNVPAEYASAKLQTLRCTSCHGIDGKPSLLDSVHLETKDLVANVVGEHDKLDQSRPHLTFIGEMLHASYIETIVGGKLTAKPRPWLDMRMPGFPNYAGDLAKGLAAIHGVVPGKAEPASPDPALAEVGKKLAAAEGYGCVTCHGVGAKGPTAAFEVEGLNFALSHERLRHEWFVRWIQNPPSVTPATKMPRYVNETDGKARRDEYDHDALKQFEALWNYIEKPE